MQSCGTERRIGLHHIAQGRKAQETSYSSHQHRWRTLPIEIHSTQQANFGHTIQHITGIPWGLSISMLQTLHHISILQSYQSAVVQTYHTDVVQAYHTTHYSASPSRYLSLCELSSTGTRQQLQGVLEFLSPVVCLNALRITNHLCKLLECRAIHKHMWRDLPRHRSSAVCASD